mgnify:CR=1 FL=1
MSDLYRIGIVGAGYIADVVAHAIAETEGVQVVAVASRRPETALEFGVRHGGIRAFDHWSDLVSWRGLDAVYVATPTSAREAICIASAERGKHVFAEKPFASLRSLESITAACRANRVAFMDATHFVHHPRTRRLREEVAERIGQVQAVNSSFFFPSMDHGNIRFDQAKEPTGAFGDMGWYSIRATAEFATPGAQLVRSHGFAQRDEITGTVVRAAGVLLLSDGCTSTWDVGFNTGACLMDLELLGQRGVISLDDFVLDWAGGFPVKTPGYPVAFTQRAGVVNPLGFERVVTPSDRRQLVYTLRHFMALAANPDGEAAAASMRITEQTQRLLDGVWSSLTIG